MSVMAIDIETKNFAHEIGGWGNTHMFQVSTVCTWNGDVGTIYIDKAVDDLKKSHNIIGFDLPVMKNAMDIYCIKKYLDDKAYIDTSMLINKAHGERYSLNNLVQSTLGENKSMDSAEAPVVWKSGGYSEVAEYCLKDCQLVYDLWQYGQNNKMVKGFSLEQAETLELGVDW